MGSSTARVTGAALIALLTLVGCGDDQSAPEDDRTSVGWLDTDVCSLVPAEDVTALIGPGATAETGRSGPRRPECEWVVPDTTQRLVLRLWQPPVPAVLTEHAERTTDVGDHEGYVESEGRGFCSMHVEAEPAWLTVDLNAPSEGFGAALCDEVTATADRVLAEVP